MKFGPVSIANAKGAILAHSLNLSGRHWRKGRILSEKDIKTLQKLGIETVTVAQLGPDDLGEDQAAEILAKNMAIGQQGLRLGGAATGRVNIYAKSAGILCVDALRINAINALSPDFSVATVMDKSRVAAGALVATVKIIPYGVGKNLVEAALGNAALALHPFRLENASLILSRTKGMKPGLIEKARLAVEKRLQGIGCALDDLAIVPHEEPALADAINKAKHDVVLLLTGSATSDIHDIGPGAVGLAGGKVIRFGMPVDPGNLLFLGNKGHKTIIGLPGCARSPALNGADWVLERIACGIPVTSADIANMGVGGLLKEIPTRPQPRAGVSPQPATAKTTVILLAAGGSSRMRGADKLLEKINGEPLLRRAANAAINAKIGAVHVVMQPSNAPRDAAIDGLEINRIEAPLWHEGMAASIRAGMASIPEDCDSVIIALADMPEISSDHFKCLSAAFDPLQNHEICRAVTKTGAPGLPVLFGARFFETLTGLQGDRGARDVIRDADEFLVDVKTAGDGAIIDLDTPEAWGKWRKNRP